MKRICAWLVTIIIGVAAASCFGFALQESIRWISNDYLYVDDAANLSISIRGGFLAAAVLAACVVIGDREPASGRRVVLAVLLITFGTVASASAVGFLGAALAHFGLLSTGEASLSACRRSAFCYSLQFGSVLGGVLFGAISAVYLLVGRRAAKLVNGSGCRR